MPSNYHLPYRGLPPEIRIMIWRLCLHTHVEVIGGEVNWQPDNLDRSQQEYLIDFESCGVDEDGYSNDNIRPFRFIGAPNLSILRLNRETHAETFSLMQHALSFDIRHLSPNASWRFVDFLGQQGLNRKIIRDIQVTMPFEKQDRDEADSTGTPLLSTWLEHLAGIPCISIEVNMLAYYEHTFNQFQVYRDVSFQDTVGHENINHPRLIEFGQKVIGDVWDAYSHVEVAEMLSDGDFEKLVIAFIGIPDVMKLTIRDGGDALLRFDRLDPEDRAEIKLESQAYRRPDAIRFTITKSDKKQSED